MTIGTVGYRRLNDPVFQEDITVAVLVGHHCGQAGEGILCTLPYIIIDPCPHSLFILIILTVQSRNNVTICAGIHPRSCHAVVFFRHLQLEGHGQVKAQVVLGNFLL